MERRQFLQLLGATGLGAALGARPLAALAAQADSVPRVLTAGEWTALEAICETLLPPVNGIDTRQVGCVNFIDKLLVHEDAATLPLYRAGLAALQAHAGQPFAEVSSPRRVTLLEGLEDGTLTPWGAPGTDQAALFRTLHFHTLLGFLAAPSFGGNRDGLGWQAIGLPGELHQHGGVTDAEVEGLARQAS